MVPGNRLINIFMPRDIIEHRLPCILIDCHNISTPKVLDNPCNECQVDEVSRCQVCDSHILDKSVYDSTIKLIMNEFQGAAP